MNITEYQRWAVKGWSNRRPVNDKGQRYYTMRDRFIMTAGLPGETGEVLEHLKKAVRDGKVIDKKELTLELGDVLYYLLIIADANGIPAQEVIDANVKKLTKRWSKKKFAARKR